MPSPDSASQSLAPETVLQNGAYVLGRVLGRGGSGVTYEARDVRLDREVAIKEFFPQGCARENFNVAAGTLSETDFRAALQQFEDEARTLARFAHPNIVDVYAVFEENATAYMVMEMVRGASLQHIVEASGALRPDQALSLIQPICDALETVHAANLLHGDISPSNIMRTQNGRVILLDFGLTRRIAPDSLATIRLSHARLGTPGYAPLEQYGRQANLGAFTDVYALAATLYFLLCGQPPIEASDRATGIALHDVRTLNSGVSESLARAIEKGLELDANARPQSAHDWCESLQGESLQGQLVQDKTLQRDAPIQAVLRDNERDEETTLSRRGQWQRMKTDDEPRPTDEINPLLDLLLGARGLPNSMPIPPLQRVPQRVPPRAPQRTSRRQNSDPFRTAPGEFVVPGCTSGCGVGCIVLMFVAFALLSFLGSLLEPIRFIVGF